MSTETQTTHIDVLDDHCYVELVEHWGSDERIIEAARMSTGKGFQGWGPKHHGSCNPSADGGVCSCTPTEGDEKLLRYLYEHKHFTPFEMSGATFEIQAPIFVFREWHRHRTQSYNELSARYTELPNMFYMPSEARINMGKQSATNKQGSDESGVIPWKMKEMWKIQELIHDAYLTSRDTYEELLTLGVAREVARVVIPVAQISRMRASSNLRNWLQFLTLRMDQSAQWEIRQCANAVATMLQQRYPRTWTLYTNA